MSIHFPSMASATTRHGTPWWLIMIAGIAVFIVGLLFLISPGMSLLVLVQLLGLYWLVTGILSLVSLSVDRSQWGWKLFTGILGVIAGLIVMRDPLWSAILVPTVLIIILAIQALLAGISQLIHSFSGGGYGLTILGVLNIIFGLILLFRPVVGLIVFPFIVGIFALIGGIALFLSSFRIHHPREAAAPPSTSQPASM
jgi:uncharacterized membrane protein HdeD (DUF308 family)